jgi:cytochrome c oxidase subunit 1
VDPARRRLAAVRQEARRRQGLRQADPDPGEHAGGLGLAYGSDHVAGSGHGVLALLLFVCFVLYYFVNWKYLSEVWLLS